MNAVRGSRLWLVGAAVAAAVVLPLGARGVAAHTSSDSLWANAARSLGGWQEPFDLRVFVHASDDVLDGRDPYVQPGNVTGPADAPYAYPPVLALALVPIAVLPRHVHDVFVPGVVFSLVLLSAVLASLYLLDVRDWRCYAVALLYPVTIEAIEYGAIGPILLLLVAVLWRFRERPIVAGAATGGAVVLKLFLWPLVVWLVVTKRVLSAAAAVAFGFALAALSWAVIAFRGLADYEHLLRRLVDVEAENSYSAFAVLRMLEVPGLAAKAVVVIAGVALLALAWRAAREGGNEGDRISLGFAVAAALVLTPILWLHYIVLLLVPIALARPRLSLLWLVPLVMTVFELLDWYRGWPRGDAQALVSTLAVVAIVLFGALHRPRGGTRLAACL